MSKLGGFLKGRNLKITKLAGHACCRVQKMALPLMERGNVVRLISQKTPSFVEAYDMFSQSHSIHQMRNAVEALAPTTDIFHVHNEPSWFVTLVKEITDKPVILDVHDSYLARLSPQEADELESAEEDYLRVTVEERNNFQLADGLVFPSEPFANLIRREFKLFQPHIILPSMVQRNLYAYDGKEWLGGLVYEGRVDLSTELEKNRHKSGFTYTMYEDLAKKAKEIDLDFHLYARKDEAFNELYKDHAILHEPVPYGKLMRKISRHDWGLVGNIFKTSEWDVAFPNKLFEYIAAGVPVVAINADYCGEFLKRTGMGIVVESLEELAERWGEHTEIRKVIARKRMHYCMENNIGALEDLYREVLNEHS